MPDGMPMWGFILLISVDIILSAIASIVLLWLIFAISAGAWIEIDEHFIKSKIKCKRNHFKQWSHIKTNSCNRMVFGDGEIYEGPPIYTDVYYCPICKRDRYQ